ncbi:MAG: FAD-dependent oxidoreductase [Desulfamplus sp.]|nr:FAD-dependent oxidoreductase [Desulfamplus sp.]
MNETVGNQNIGTVLVIGAGISGIRSALDMAECGYRVILTDRQPHIGGILSQLDYQFPTNRCGMCKMLPMVNRDSSSQYCLRKGLFHKNIELMLSSEIISLKGEAGAFQAALRRRPGLILTDLCIGCAECASVCPVEVPDLFNVGLSMRKAVYLPVPHKIPNTFVIDTDSCNMCKACEPVCPTGAIRFSDQGRRQFHILVVDDELIVRDSLKEWLEDEGFSVDMAESGKDALQKLSSQSYHLMLLDIKMPEMDGVTVLMKSKAQFADLPVLMMTAYATVETAVGAMKTGAMDYLLKPFDTESVIPKIEAIYRQFETSQAININVDAVILSCGTDFYDPAEGKNSYGYKIFPGVLTGLEFERIISGTGPSNGRFLRPHDNKPVKKIAWFQCVGSRDLQANADFCSSVCCMYAVKEALLAKRATDGEVDTTIFYMDMRTFRKEFQRYRDKAEKEHGVKFENARIHSVITNQDCSADNLDSSNLTVRYIDPGGTIHQEAFDMIVLPVGQRPSKGIKELSDIAGISLNDYGFLETVPFFGTKTSRPGILAGGSSTGLKDISDSIIQASAAAMCASTVIQKAGKVTVPEPEQKTVSPELLRDASRIMIAICTCGKTISHYIDETEEDIDEATDNNTTFSRNLLKGPDISNVIFIDRLCTSKGWAELVGQIKRNKLNRLVVGACMPYLYSRKFHESEAETGLNSSLVGIADILTPVFQNSRRSVYQNSDSVLKNQNRNDFDKKGEKIAVSLSENFFMDQEKDKRAIRNAIETNLKMEISRIRFADPAMLFSVPVTRSALVIGGGISGMTAALAIGESGFHVDLIEKREHLGGNIRRFTRTIEGYQVKELLDKILEKIEKHPLIQIHTQARVIASVGEVGHFITTVENMEKTVQTFEHGVVILATGGREADITSYGYGSSRAIMTQLEFEEFIAERSANISDNNWNSGSLSDSANISDRAMNNEENQANTPDNRHGRSEVLLFATTKNESPMITAISKDFQINADRSVDFESLSSVVMIQCAGTREEPRNYCSRVCCTTSLRHALFLKKLNPEINIYILYRDMMSYGFSESYYTEARKAGIIFIRYTEDNKPKVNFQRDLMINSNQADSQGNFQIKNNHKVDSQGNVQINNNHKVDSQGNFQVKHDKFKVDAKSNISEAKVSVRCFEPIIGQTIEIEADIIVLAAGVVPNFPSCIADSFGVLPDEDGFFQEADSKWRPVESLKEGVFACGLVHSPRNITESIATAQAAAKRAIRLLSHTSLASGKITAKVRHSICSLCGLCIETCPYRARSFDQDHAKVLVNAVMCQGCGACATICPNKASLVEGFASQQVFEMIDACFIS